MALTDRNRGPSGAASSAISPTSARRKSAGGLRRRFRTASLRAQRARKATPSIVNPGPHLPQKQEEGGGAYGPSARRG